MYDYVMMADYKSLKAGDRVKILRSDRDSGYAVYHVTTADGRMEKPLQNQVVLESHLKINKQRLQDQIADIDRVLNP